MQKKNLLGWAGIGVLALVLLAPALGFAQTTGDIPVVNPPRGNAPLTSGTDVLETVNTIFQWIATLFWVAALLFVFYAAFLYLTAGGNEEKVKRATRQFVFAVVAIIIGLLAFGLPTLIENILQRR